MSGWTSSTSSHPPVGVRQAVAGLIGTVLFLLPTMTLLAYFSWPLFKNPWSVREFSGNAGGWLWPVLLQLRLGFGLLALQDVSETIKRAAALHGDGRFETHYERLVQ